MSARVGTPMSDLARRIDAALPQTQCTRCGYPDCAAYARAVAAGDAGINQCPPGGAEGVARLSAITGLPVVALNPEHGVESPRAVALIDENWCIGCTLCIKACPTDAIVGANKLMHTVMESHCTGCELCVPVCPVDCIQLENATGSRTGWAAWSAEQADEARQRYAARTLRLERTAPEADKDVATLCDPEPASATPQPAAAAPAADAAEARRAAIAAAMERARQLRARS